MSRSGRLKRHTIIAVAALVVAGAAFTAVATVALTASWLKPVIAAALIALVSAVLAPWATSAAEEWRSRRERAAKKIEAASDAQARSPQEPGKRFPKVSNLGPQILGVNPAIPAARRPDDSTAILGDDNLPPYVPRDIDYSLRSEVRKARDAADGRLFVLVGAPLSGKTRTAYEAIREVLPDWNLFFPGSAAELQAVIESGTNLRNTIIWVDEFGEYLEGELPLHPGSVRRLISRGVGAILVGTLWSGQFEKLKYGPSLDALDNLAEDSVARQRSVLRTASVFAVPTQLSRDERANTASTGVRGV
jgi:hypothetical protein